jgi:transposase
MCIRDSLNTGSKPAKFFYDNEQKQELKLWVAQGKAPKIYRQVYHKGIAPVNLVGIWGEGFKKPMWIITNLEPEQGLAIYRMRMKIETSFRVLKSLMHIYKIIGKSRAYLENMFALYSSPMPSDC